MDRGINVFRDGRAVRSAKVDLNLDLLGGLEVRQLKQHGLLILGQSRRFHLEFVVLLDRRVGHREFRGTIAAGVEVIPDRERPRLPGSYPV